MIERQVLSFPFADRRFNYRVAAIVRHHGHVLVCREDDDDFVMLPGGRVELGEASAPALGRELVEELGRDWQPGRLVFTSENFYFRDGQHFHEIGLFYEVNAPSEPDFLGAQPWLMRRDEGHDLEFSWVPTNAEALTAVRLLPAWLPHRLGELPLVVEHLVFDTREGGA